jgi:hypothetical protein
VAFEWNLKKKSKENVGFLVALELELPGILFSQQF